MRHARTLVQISLVVSLLIVFGALISTSTMRGEISGYGIGSWVSLALVSIFVATICSWPWLAALSLAARSDGQLRAIVFAVVAVGIAALASPSIVAAPAEGVGYNVIFCMLLIWVAYPLSRVFGR